jgi:hypothetical protein
MADINIKKKNNNQPVWPWVLGILVIAGLIWAAVELFDTDAQREYGPVAVDEPGRTTTDDNNGDADVFDLGANNVDDFVEFVEERDASEEASVDHEYTHDGLNKLADAIDALENDLELDDLDVNERTDLIRDNADYITEDWEDTDHSDSIRRAFEVATDLIAAIQSRYFPQLEGQVNQLRNQTQNFDPNNLTLEQKQIIEQYFVQASEILRSMDQQADAAEENNGQVQDDGAVEGETNRHDASDTRRPTGGASQEHHERTN